jgi:hypothetical protein
MNIKRNASTFVYRSLFFISVVRLFIEIHSQKPEKPVVGVCLEGDTSLRLSETLALYERGVINYIIVSGGVNDPKSDNIPASVMKEFLVDHGVPASIIEIDEDSKHTDDHPDYVIPIMKRHNFENLLIITSGYHLVRAYLRFLYTLSSEGYDYRLYGCAGGKLSAWFQKSPTESKIRLSIFLYDELKKIRTYRNLASLDFAWGYVQNLKSHKSAKHSTKIRS